MSYISKIRAQDIEHAQENTSWCDEHASALRIYAYVNNDPLNGTDPSGLCAQTGCGNANPSYSLVGFLAGGAEVAAEGTAAGGAAVIGVGVAVVGGISLYPSSLGTNDVCSPAPCGNQWVVRGGAGSATSFQNGTQQGPNGFGFSVQTAPGVSVDELARGGSFPNNQISVSTTNQLQAIPGVTVNAPTPGFGTYHGTVNVPNPPSPGIFTTISGAFTQMPNPYVTPR